MCPDSSNNIVITSGQAQYAELLLIGLYVQCTGCNIEIYNIGFCCKVSVDHTFSSSSVVYMLTKNHYQITQYILHFDEIYCYHYI